VALALVLAAASDRSVSTCATRAGADTDAILTEVGFSTDEIAVFRASGAVGG
jgi:crotonobetainyl-CoA:carnitine CoA-transferase CaiB-like acyl-CoA transferase